MSTSSSPLDVAAAVRRRRIIETALDTITWPLTVAICAWIAVVFGLVAPRNAVVPLTIVICALCVASAIFLIDDFDSPFDGPLHVSSDALRDTVSHIDEP